MHSANVLSAWVVHAHDALSAAAAETEFTPRELAALTLVESHPGRSIEWLRPRVGLTQSGAVRLVDRLEARGLVRRSRRGGRGVALEGSAAGAEQLANWNAARELVIDRLLAGLSADQRASVVGSLATALLHQPRERPQADAVCRTCEWPACGDACPVDHSVR
jgi:DNA-binding MarR family transcriptional regulator